MFCSAWERGNDKREEKARLEKDKENRNSLFHHKDKEISTPRTPPNTPNTPILAPVSTDKEIPPLDLRK